MLPEHGDNLTGINPFSALPRLGGSMAGSTVPWCIWQGTGLAASRRDIARKSLIARFRQAEAANS